MRKLSLRLDDLAVESFDTSQQHSARGTVVGRQETGHAGSGCDSHWMYCGESQTCQSCNYNHYSCNGAVNTCQPTCNYQIFTCGGNGSGITCYPGQDTCGANTA